MTSADRIRKLLHIMTLGLLGLGAAGTLGFHFWIGIGLLLNEGRNALGLIPFAIWATAPYLLFGWLCRRPSLAPGPTIILLLGAATVTLFPAFAIVDAFFLHPDAQAGFVFLFFPVLQFVVIGISYGLAAIARPRQKAA